MSVDRHAALAAEDGTAAVSFALVLPLLLTVSFGIVDFSLLLSDYHRAGEATRRGARAAIIADPIADLDSLAAGGTVVCRGGDGVSCTGGAVTNAPAFDVILAEMQAIHGGIGAANVQVEYRSSGLGDPNLPNGILPLVTVRLVGLRHSFLALGTFPGLPTTLDYASFATAQLGPGARP